LDGADDQILKDDVYAHCRFLYHAEFLLLSLSLALTHALPPAPLSTFSPFAQPVVKAIVNASTVHLHLNRVNRAFRYVALRQAPQAQTGAQRWLSARYLDMAVFGAVVAREKGMKESFIFLGYASFFFFLTTLDRV
jgi:hypothetical protein